MSQAPETVRDRWRYLIPLLRLLWSLSPGQMVANAGVTLLIGLTPLVTLAALRHLVDRIAGTTGRVELGEAAFWAAVLVGARAFQETCWTVGSHVRTQIQERLRAQIQERVLAKAQALPLLAFEQPEVFDQLQRIERGVDRRLFSTMSFLFNMGNNTVTFVALLVFVGAAHWALPVILAVGSFLSLLSQLRLCRERYLTERKQTEPQRRLDYLGGLMTGREAAAEVRLFGLRDYLLITWERLAIELRGERLALARREFRMEGIASVGQSLTLGLGLVVVVALIARGGLSVGQYAAFIAAVQSFQMTFWSLLWDAALIDGDLRYIRDFFQYLERPDERPTTNDDRPTTDIQPSSLVVGRSSFVEFHRVRFRYPGSERWVLDGVDIEIGAGERIALVGENGAGKTTLARLLLGLYPPSEGTISVDGQDLSAIEPAAWRRRATAVFQEFQQYQLTVRENIAVGDLERATDAAVERAARLSGADGVAAELPKGYATLLGKAFEDGNDLSLGQWQKIAVARAYLREAEVLVLDEPTAALDAKAEVELYRQFRDVSAGKTVLLISHRLGSARLADRILVLADGRIVEEGTHAELMARGGRYATMLGTQAAWYA